MINTTDPRRCRHPRCTHRFSDAELYTAFANAEAYGSRLQTLRCPKCKKHMKFYMARKVYIEHTEISHRPVTDTDDWGG